MLEKISTESTKIYVAQDGTEFTSRSKCHQYEINKNIDSFFTELEKYRIKDIDELPLLCEEVSGSSTFFWYLLDTKEANENFTEACEKYYDEYFEPLDDLNIVCIEKYNDSIFLHSFEKSVRDCIRFFKDFDIKVDFKSSNISNNIALNIIKRVLDNANN